MISIFLTLYQLLRKSLTQLAPVFLKNLMQKLSVKSTFLAFLPNIWLKIVFFLLAKCPKLFSIPKIYPSALPFPNFQYTITNHAK
jgi:hypothetical protein